MKPIVMDSWSLYVTIHEASQNTSIVCGFRQIEATLPIKSISDQVLLLDMAAFIHTAILSPETWVYGIGSFALGILS